jgi:hypothetical protein
VALVRSGDAAHSAQRLAELGLAHADQAVMAEAQRAVEQIRAVLADGAESLAGGGDFQLVLCAEGQAQRLG